MPTTDRSIPSRRTTRRPAGSTRRRATGRARALLVLAACTVVAASCGGDDATTDAAEGSVTPATAAPTAAPATTAAGAPATTTVVADDAYAVPPAAATTAAPAGATPTLALGDTGLGEVLVDAGGFTLYLFTKDEGTTSTCEADCAASWPPVVVDGTPTVGDGLDGALVGTTERPDGTVQVTYGGHPLYRWAGDMGPGQTTGQGVGGVWFVVDASGAAVS